LRRWIVGVSAVLLLGESWSWQIKVFSFTLIPPGEMRISEKTKSF
jgi:hypothetical protein